MGIFSRTETIDFRSFMDGSYKEKKKMTLEEIQAVGIMGISGMVTILKTDNAYASSFVQERIMHAFQPLVDLIQGLSYPVAFLMIGAGILLIMMGQKHRGLHMIKWAGIGYVLMEFLPSIMQILVEIGKGMKAQ